MQLSTKESCHIMTIQMNMTHHFQVLVQQYQQISGSTHRFYLEGVELVLCLLAAEVSFPLLKIDHIEFCIINITNL